MAVGAVAAIAGRVDKSSRGHQDQSEIGSDPSTDMDMSLNQNEIPSKKAEDSPRKRPLNLDNLPTTKPPDIGIIYESSLGPPAEYEDN